MGPFKYPPDCGRSSNTVVSFGWLGNFIRCSCELGPKIRWKCKTRATALSLPAAVTVAFAFSTPTFWAKPVIDTLLIIISPTLSPRKAVGDIKTSALTTATHVTGCSATVHILAAGL
jgi:hypothetical protein